MPKQTFFNLPDEKRTRILDVAMGEFAEKGYKESSVSAIVCRAGIAKGSFYQYFEDKDDLYFYAVSDLISTHKLVLSPREFADLAGLTMIGFLRMAIHRQLEECRRQPHLLRISIDLMRIVDEPIYHRIQTRYKGTRTMFLPLIQQEIVRGGLDPGINAQLLNFILMSVGQYLMHRFGPDDANQITREAIDEILDDLEYILQNGVYRKGA